MANDGCGDRGEGRCYEDLRAVEHDGNTFLCGRHDPFAGLRSSLGADASPLLHFLLESVSRSTGLVETFCDRSLSASAADHSDLSHAQHTTAAAMALIADLAAQGSTSLNTCPASRS